MIAGRDSKGCFFRGNVPWNKKVDISQREVTAFVGHKKLIGEGVLKLERIQVICPACGQRVEAVTTDGRVKGHCAVAKKYMDFLIETQRVPTDKNHTDETKAKLSAAAKKSWQDPEFRAKHSATMKKFWEDPEYRARQNAAMKKRWQDPEYRARQIAARAGKPLTSEHRAKISASLKRRHEAKRRANEDR